MEVPGKDVEIKKGESHMTSAAAFVEGGIQDACDDACSICLEAFCDSDPSTVTSCKHEFHLQCVLEWCQRSSNCPMCWQAISLKDPTSQELLEAVEHERSFRFTPSRNSTILHHPSLRDFELQHLPMGANDPELEDRIIQHLAAAATVGRTHRVARREGSRSRSSTPARPQFVVLSADPNASFDAPVSETESRHIEVLQQMSSVQSNQIEVLQQMSSVQSNQISPSAPGSSGVPAAREGLSHDNRSSSLPIQDSAGPSEFHSFSDSWKSGLNSISTKYKESISKSTKGWKEKLFSRSSSMADIGSEVKREVNAGIATLTRMIERLETRDNNRHSHVSQANAVDSHNHDNRNEIPSNSNNSASLGANSISS